MKGYQKGNKSLTSLCYADDEVLISKLRANLQKLFRKLATIILEYIKTVELNCAPCRSEKIKSLVVSKEFIMCQLVGNDEIINQVFEVEYLGVIISSNRKINYLETESNVKICKTVIRSVMIYVTETYTDTNRTKQLLRISEMIL
ncbi:hypothetical protein ABEB36_009064 [Hypothenemus hampei]|uniref:Reverse transcriptase n=1 Tax=Hypothenemus hampei TaxID=57062 RepID=A0ABD1EPF3_HYPHA